jgi:resolvase-like protein
MFAKRSGWIPRSVHCLQTHFDYLCPFPFHLRFRLPCRIILDMQEILSRTDDSKAPLRDQEFYELRLDDSDEMWDRQFVVREAHAQWHEECGQVVWDEAETEILPTLEEAKERYANYRSFTEQYLDSTGIFKEAVIGILAAVAEQERVRLSERTIAGLECARAQGRVGGRPKAEDDPKTVQAVHGLRGKDQSIQATPVYSARERGFGMIKIDPRCCTRP